MVSISGLRLRKALCIRAYNIRSADETLEEQFAKLSYRGEDGRVYLLFVDVKTVLGFTDTPWIDEVFKRLWGESRYERLIFSEFIAFLESGQVPSSDGSSSGAMSEISPLKGKGTPCPGGKVRPASKAASMIVEPGRERAKPHPPQPPRAAISKHEQALLFAQTLAESSGGEGGDAPEGVDKEQEGGEEGRSLAACKGMQLVRTTSTDSMHRGPVGSVWRKRETVRQERTVQYTTVDADGSLQELVEKETSETEVLHMESRETGEFAHRETTIYEQTETFNNEVVAEQRGQEEYVHLKSVDDEFEYMDSTMPKHAKQQNGEEEGEEGRREAGVGEDAQPQLSPRLNASPPKAQFECEETREQQHYVPQREELDELNEEEMAAYEQYLRLQEQFDAEQREKEQTGYPLEEEDGEEEEEEDGEEQQQHQTKIAEAELVEDVHPQVQAKTNFADID